jgi:hypothetical protein
VLRDFMDSIPFLEMRPMSDVVRSGVPQGSPVFVLGSPGKAYAAYLHHGSPRKGQKPQYAVDATARSTGLGLDLPAGSYSAEWIDPKSGKVAGQERFSHKGGTRTIVSPQYREDIALRVRVR